MGKVQSVPLGASVISPLKTGSPPSVDMKTPMTPALAKGSVVVPCRVGVVNDVYLSVLDGPVSSAVDRPMVRVGQSRSSSASTHGGMVFFAGLRAYRGRQWNRAICHLTNENGG